MPPQARLFRFFKSKSGTAAIEFAFIAPLMIVLFAGTVEVGRAYQVYNAVNRVASQIAITYADCSDSPAGTCQTEANNYMTSQFIANVAPQLTASSLALKIFQVTMSGTTPTVVYAAPSGATMSATQIAAAQASLTNGQSGVVVSGTYKHTLAFFQALMSTALSSYLSVSFNVVQLKS
jgi:Flp pilus assembly protein TadG